MVSNKEIWSDELAQRLLSALPPEEIARYWGSRSTDARRASNTLQDQLQELLTWARQDEPLRRCMVRTWRERHQDVVAAADHAVTEGLTANAVLALATFPREHVLLALLTDEFDDGRALAETFVGHVARKDQCPDLQAALARLVGDPAAGASRHQVRLVILGGHPQDECKLALRLFGNSPFEVRWKTFERKPSSGIVKKNVANVLRHADAVLIVTGMVSHMVMKSAKDYAQRTGIRWQCIEKATDNQLQKALQELFPDLTADWLGRTKHSLNPMR